MIRRTWLVPLLLALATSPTELQAFDPKVGESLADFRLPRIDTAEPMSLSSLRGKKTLLIVFASW